MLPKCYHVLSKSESRAWVSPGSKSESRAWVSPAVKTAFVLWARASCVESNWVVKLLLSFSCIRSCSMDASRGVSRFCKGGLLPVTKLNPPPSFEFLSGRSLERSLGEAVGDRAWDCGLVNSVSSVAGGPSVSSVFGTLNPVLLERSWLP